ncbi:MAG TPA: 2Fe-2S iron-sulfur cluster-binding protein [Acidimicrobiales bacterium]|nr:2Fe-2S iron-sulfur cluster-binding protein [Acidimicrobiales bacterium]
MVTLEGLEPALRDRWVAAFVGAGASQCGFCTPGIVMRLSALPAQGGANEHAIRTALLAHLCRCTGWQSIVEAAGQALDDGPLPRSPERDPLLASWRAQLEGPLYQSVGPSVIEGDGGFASDTAPQDSLVAIRDGDAVSVGSDLRDARRGLPKVQGRRSGAALSHPVDVSPGAWALSLRTTWVEPGYLEPDASWCRPGGRPASPLANGGAFGGKRRSTVTTEAYELASAHGRPVLALWTREQVVRSGPKRPPVAIGVRGDGSGVMRVARTPGSPGLDAMRAAVAAVAPRLEFQEVEVPGPPVGPELRAAGWAEAAVVSAVVRLIAHGACGRGVPVEVVGRDGGRAIVTLHDDDRVEVEVWAGEPLDETTLRSYCLGAVHQGLSWVRSEGVAVDEAGRVQDLTVRSFGILSARETPPVAVSVRSSGLLSVNGSDAVFAATAAAAWLADGLGPSWPTRRGPR